MPNYEEMYITLFRETTKAIFNLQKAQRRTEEMYIAGGSINNLVIINPDNDINSEDTDKQPPQG